MKPAIGPEHGVRRRLLGVRHAQHQDRGVDEKDEPASGPQQPRRLRDPAVGVGPDRGAIFGDREVEACVRVRHDLRVAVEQREVQSVFGLQAASRRELLLGVVDPNRSRAATGEPGRDVGRAAAELDRVLAGEIGRQHMNLRLWNVPVAPFLGAGRKSPASFAVIDIVDSPLVPGLAVAPDVVGQVVRRRHSGVLEGGGKALRSGPPPGLPYEAGQQRRIDPIEIDRHPTESTNIGGARERFGVQVDQLRLRLEARLDRDAIRALTADREDLVADPEGDVGLPGDTLLGLGQRESDPADVVKRRQEALILVIDLGAL